MLHGQGPGSRMYLSFLAGFAVALWREAFRTCQPGQPCSAATWNVTKTRNAIVKGHGQTRDNHPTLAYSGVEVGLAKPAHRWAGMNGSPTCVTGTVLVTIPPLGPRVYWDTTVHTLRKSSRRRPCMTAVLCCRLPLVYPCCHPTRVDAPWLWRVKSRGHKTSAL